jgi:uncharacterized Tic20 family protein
MEETQNINQEITFWGMDQRTFIVIMHLSQFAGYLVPLLGLILPIVMWATNNDDALIDEHGKNIINWLISLIIYTIISAILTVLVIGIFLLIVLSVFAIVFPIIGAVKAGDNKVWKYPLTIKFF